jgi:hypothetical protein
MAMNVTSPTAPAISKIRRRLPPKRCVSPCDFARTPALELGAAAFFISASVDPNSMLTARLLPIDARDD